MRSLSRQLGVTDPEIRRALDNGESADFEQTDVYQRVFARAQKIAHRKLPRAMLPEIALKSPKITRKLTTAWFANRVDQRYGECLARGGVASSARLNFRGEDRLVRAAKAWGGRQAPRSVRARV